MPDLIGKRFGLLVVQELDPLFCPGRNRSHYWKCICDCGKQVTLHISKLLKGGGNGRSCGCTNEAARDYLFRRYKNGAKNKKLEFTLTNEICEQLFQENCFYCGEPPNQFAQQWLGSSFKYNGIDRLDPAKGYVRENVVVCCGICNRIKHVQTESSFKEWIEKVITKLSERGV